MRGSQQEKCPRCGFGAGIYIAPREERNTATPVRCLSCRHEALIDEWQRVAAEIRGVEAPAVIWSSPNPSV